MRDLHGSEKAIHRLSMEMLHGVSHGFGPSALYSWLVPPTVTGIFHVLTRCVGVWFAYLAVEGFLHTKAGPVYGALVCLGRDHGAGQRSL